MNPGKPSLEEGIEKHKMLDHGLNSGAAFFLSSGAMFHQSHKKLLGVCSGPPGAINKVFQSVRTILKGMCL
jgi:hypothetical protein